MSPQKHYVNCGIQTDFYDISSGSNVPASESDTTLANGSLVFESAYSQSPDSQNHDLPSLLSSRYCLDRSTGIAYGRPSEPRLSTEKRVISLSSVSSTGKFKATMLGDKLRLVSMPERGKYASVSAKEFLLETQCTDDLDITHNHEQMERLYPADLPQTPSPPSSPESVTIIGNNTHVPGSFLRQPGYTDNDGWVSWTNSPPRPIPALHGPSSLPYARCPSGAEGTLIEGNDLSHKIWGLGIDDSQMVHLPATSRSYIRQTSQPQDHRPPQAPTVSSQDEFTLSHYYERDAVIDLSRPATFYGHVGTQRVLSKGVPALPMATSKQTIFVPASANMKAYSSMQRYAPPSEKPLPYVFSAPRSSAFNNAPEQHRQPDAQNFLPTPPGTSSPSWTPIFSHQPEMAIAKSMVLNLNPKVSKADSYSPKIYSPISNLEDDSSHIRAIMQQNAIHEADIVYDSKVVPRMHSFQNDPFTIQAYLPTLDSPQVDDVSPCLKVTSGNFQDPFMVFPTKHENSLHDGILPQTEAGSDTQGSTERRRNLSYQQPRSIPLARLIQRRLSSVAEEGQSSTNILFSFLKEAQTGGFTRLKGLSLESLGRQMPRIGLLDEEISTREIFTVQTEADHQLVYEAEPMLNSEEPNVVVKLPQRARVLRHNVDSNRGKKFLRYDGQATLSTRPTANQPKHKA